MYHTNNGISDAAHGSTGVMCFNLLQVSFVIGSLHEAEQEMRNELLCNAEAQACDTRVKAPASFSRMSFAR